MEEVKICDRCVRPKYMEEHQITCETCEEVRSLNRQITGTTDKKEKKKLRGRNARMLIQYGIGLKKYHSMLANQDYKCKLCGKLEEESKNKLAIDHCHETLKVRGLLCANCNLVLGLIKEDTTTLENMINYLKIHKENN